MIKRDIWHLATIPEGSGYNSDAMDALGEPIDFRKWKGGHEAKAPAFSRITNPADWEGDPEPEERKSIVPGYILDETVTLFSADGGSGKSYLELQLAIARALASEWIGLVPAPGRTLVLSTEDDTAEMKRRMHGILQFYKSDARPFGAHWADLGDNVRLIDLVGEDSILASLGKGGSFEPTEVYKALDDFMAEFQPGLTALDVLVSFFCGEERNRTHVRQFANLLLALCRNAILLLAHPSLTGMNTGSRLSGSTDWQWPARRGYRA
jgi:RecA-family ATPase